MRKGSTKKRENKTVHILDVKPRGTAIEADVKGSDSKGSAKIILKYWSQNNKTKDITVQINSVKGNER